MIWIVPILNAIFGWSIIGMLQWMLFHPENKFRLLMIDVQGIVPKYLQEWKSQLADYASGFINIQQLKEKVLQNDNQDAIQQMLEKKVDDFLENKLKEKLPVLSFFFTEGLRKQIRDILMEELMNMLPAVMNQVADHAEESLDISSMITNKLEPVNADFIHSKYREFVKPSLQKLQLSITVLGFILGWIEVWLIAKV